MRNIDKVDIPPNGSYQDMTIRKAGVDYGGDFVIVCEIDNGEFIGKKVSDKGTPELFRHTNFDALVGMRISAKVWWKEFETKNGTPVIGYKLSDIDYPHAPSMLDKESFSFVRE